jgi:hypothetical protein
MPKGDSRVYYFDVGRGIRKQEFALVFRDDPATPSLPNQSCRMCTSGPSATGCGAVVQ